VIGTARSFRADLGDGAATTVEIWGDSGPILLCVHGITSSRKMWTRTAQFFAPRYRVVAYDARGHGDSADVVGPMSLARSVADLEAVKARLGEPIHALIGHSWGGAVVILGGRGSDIGRVIALDPMVRQLPGTWDGDFVDDLREVFAVPPTQREPAIREMFAGALPVEIDAKVHAMRGMRIETIAALGGENFVDDGRWDLRPQLEAYPIPLLLAAADPSDSVIRPEDLAFIGAEGGAHVTVEVLGGEGHTYIRNAFEKFAPLAARFLAAT